MKKFLIIISLITLTLKVMAISGNGSSGSPFYGTISTNITWSVGDPNYGSTVYVGIAGTPDITITTGGHLTIAPGITVIFTQLTSDLIITGSGLLTADGTSSNNILFTKGSSVSHWGHITFEVPGTQNPITGTGSFKYCKVEYGYANGIYPNPNSAGGAIQINAPNVTIENCVFNNNYATFGGGVTVNTGQNTVIRNSLFKSNSANECAGGLLLFVSTVATIENCIFESNSCSGASAAYYGGGGIWTRQNTSKIINCTFVKNTSPRPGDGLYSYSSPGSRVVNSIFWGSNDQFSTTGTACNLTNCAFDTQKPGTSINSIIINSNNSDPEGPSFKATDGSDWSIKVISPCRDAGSTPSPAVPTDYVGNSRIGAYDIGAYEVQYNSWKTTASSADWNTAGNWDQGIPTSTQNIVIPSGASNYPTGSTSLNYTIGTGYGFVLDPGAKATFGTLTNNGDIKMRSDASGISSLITDNSVTAIMEIYLTGGGTPPNYKWHYISVPVSSADTSIFQKKSKNVAQYASNRPGAPWYDALQGWVAADGWSFFGGGYDPPYAFGSLVLGKGYDYYNAANQKYSFSGSINTSTYNAGLAYTSGNDALYGFNLLGNPFSSGLDWDQIILDPSYPTNTSKSLYFTRDNTQCSYVAGAGIPGDVSGIIPPIQAFFVKTYASGKSINLLASARTNGTIHPRYKSESVIPLVRLSVFRDSIFNNYSVCRDSIVADTVYYYMVDSVAFDHNIYDEAVVRFDDAAQPTFDNDFDAIKMFLSSDNPYIYSSVGGVKYAINGIPYPATSIEIPLIVNFTTSGNHTISAAGIQGLDNYSVKLKDNTTGIVTDLRTTPDAIFSADPGVITGRFILKVADLLTDIEDVTKPGRDFNIYKYQGNINILPSGDEWNGKTGTIRVIDLTGRSVGSLNNNMFNKNEIIQILSPQTPGLYLVEMRAGTLRYVGKVVIK